MVKNMWRKQMPNDPVQDGHFKTNNSVNEWDEVVFSDLPELELFWLSPGKQPAYRKLEDGSIINTKTREESTFTGKKVFVRS